MMPHEKLRIIGKAFSSEKVTQAQARTAAVQILEAADRLEVLERERTEFFDRWHDERRKREKLAHDIERCYATDGGMMEDELLKCPKCGSEEVTVSHLQRLMANTGEHYCHSVKTHDANSEATCLDCEWKGWRYQLVHNAEVTGRAAAGREGPR